MIDLSTAAFYENLPGFTCFILKLSFPWLYQQYQSSYVGYYRWLGNHCEVGHKSESLQSPKTMDFHGINEH